MISIVICGLVRDPQRLREKVQKYADWRKLGFVDQIVFSTWIGEIAKFGELKEFLLENRVEIVEVEEPRLVLKGGHQLHQMVSLHYGLGALSNQNQFVLKTRVDLAENTQLMEFDFQSGTPLTHDPLGVGLKHKIIVEYAQLLYPFLCGDAQFFGHFQDIQKLVNMSNKFEVIYNRLAVEQTFFFEPFSEIRVFQEHLFWNLPHVSEASKNKSAQLRFMMSEPSLMEPILHWWNILHSYFKIGWGDQEGYPIPRLGDIADAFKYNAPEKSISADSSDCISHTSFVSALVEINPIGAAITAELPKASLEITVVQRPRFEAFEAFRKEFSDLPAPKGAHLENQQSQVYGAAQHFFVKDTLDDAASRYHDQVTFLRRENDQLKKLLNVGSSTTPIHSLISRFLKPGTILKLRVRYPKLSMFYAKYFMTKINDNENN